MNKYRVLDKYGREIPMPKALKSRSPCCKHCQREKKLESRGLCKACYVRLYKRNELDAYPPHKERVAVECPCKECGQLSKIRARGLCMRCYTRMRLNGTVDKYETKYDRINQKVKGRYVYKIVFSENQIYFGITSNLRARLDQHAHKYAYTNKRVHDLMGQVRYVQIVGIFDDAITAHECEKESLAKAREKGEWVLNAQTSPCGFKLSDKNANNSYGKQINQSKAFCCSICKEVKPRKDFHRDASRYNGLSSKCKSCSHSWRRIKDWCKRKNIDMKKHKVYQVWKRNFTLMPMQLFELSELKECVEKAIERKLDNRK